MCSKPFHFAPHHVGACNLSVAIRKGAAAYVDYAHTPDALENALDALRAHVPEGGRLLTMFGCGGDRDSGKRPEMGRAATAKADVVFITDDNPRHEDAAAIRSEIFGGCPNAHEVADRKLAIEQILAMAEEKDLVLLAGKDMRRDRLSATQFCRLTILQWRKRRWLCRTCQMKEASMADLWRGSEVIDALKAHLMVTPNADWQANGVAIDTRDLTAGDIFVALPGERVDGHDFVTRALIWAQ